MQLNAFHDFRCFSKVKEQLIRNPLVIKCLLLFTAFSMKLIFYDGECMSSMLNIVFFPFLMKIEEALGTHFAQK